MKFLFRLFAVILALNTEVWAACEFVEFDANSNIIRAKLIDTTDNQGMTGLTSASSGLKIAIISNNEATTTAYTVAGSTIEGITTLGTYAAPTATKVRFKEVDATNHPGIYEFQFADARFSVASAKSLIFSASGVTNLQEMDCFIPLLTANPSVDVVAISGDTTAADNAELMFDGTGYAGGTAKLGVDTVAISGDTTAADNAELMFDGTGYVGGTAKLDVDVVSWNGTAVGATAQAGFPTVTIKDGTGTGEVDTNAGAVVAVTTATTCTTASTCSALGATAKSEVNAEVVDVIRTDTGTELAACPTASATLNEKVTYLFQYFRHKLTSTSSVMTLEKDDGTTDLCTNAISDDGTTFSRGEMN